jgi:hypothetical protein
MLPFMAKASFCTGETRKPGALIFFLLGYRLGKSAVATLAHRLTPILAYMVEFVRVDYASLARKAFSVSIALL